MRHFKLSLALLLAFTSAHAGDLLSTNLSSRMKSVVYELRGAPPDQVRLLAGVMKQRFPQAELIDAAAMPEDQLSAKLQKSFILITLLDPSSRLLPLVAAPLPLKLDSGTLHWNDFSAPAKNLRVDFIGRNQYGAGYAMVFAVGSMAQLQGNDIGQYSYSIRGPEGILRRGTYDEEFTPTVRDRLKAADARADLHDFFTTLERIHADPFARVSEQDYRRMKDQSFADIDRTARDGLVSIEDLAYILRYAAAFIRDGHTEMGWGVPSIYTEPLDHRRFPPFRFHFENGRFYISGAKDQDLVGLELLSINGAPPVEFFRPALDRIAGEILSWRASRLAMNQDFWLWFTNIAGKTDGCCKLKLRDDRGSEIERAVDPVSVAEYGRIRLTVARKFPRHNGTELQLLDSGKTAHFIYPAFQYSEGEMRKIGEIFRQIRESKSEDVIVDLRSNGGGEVQMGSLIFSYLTPKPVPQFQGGRIKISPEAFRDFFGGIGTAMAGQTLTVNNVSDLGPQLAGTFAALGEMRKQPQPFTGRVWLLVDHRTFSAANLFSAAFQKAKLGTILGYETGQPTDICGDPVIDFKLPHSGISYRVSASASFVTKPTPGAEHGILPDVPMDRKILTPFHEDPDPELAFTLDYVHKHR